MNNPAMAATGLFFTAPTSYNFGCSRINKTSSSSRRASRILQVRAASSQDDDDAVFQARLQKLLKSSQGKRSRKNKKGSTVSTTSSKNTSKIDKKESTLIPPVPLEDPVAEGLVVELGFSPYTERLNGRFAALGLAAILLVELASGSAFLDYHSGAILGIQIYTMLGLGAVIIKIEKERKSIWPRPSAVTAAGNSDSSSAASSDSSGAAANPNPEEQEQQQQQQ